MAIAYLEGVLQIANIFLAIVAGGIAVTLFKVSSEKKDLKAWIPLIFALVFFAFEEIFGGLRSFEIFSTPYLTHIIPSAILGFLIWSLVLQIQESKMPVESKTKKRKMK